MCIIEVCIIPLYATAFNHIIALCWNTKKNEKFNSNRIPLSFWDGLPHFEWIKSAKAFEIKFRFHKMEVVLL